MDVEALCVASVYIIVGLNEPRIDCLIRLCKVKTNVEALAIFYC